jgi:hypothetical protein
VTGYYSLSYEQVQLQEVANGDTTFEIEFELIDIRPTLHRYIVDEPTTQNRNVSKTPTAPQKANFSAPTCHLVAVAIARVTGYDQAPVFTF